MINNNIIGVLGLGLTGISCIKQLSTHNCNFIVVDTRDNPPNLAAIKNQYPELRIYCGNEVPVALQQVDELIVSPGVSLEHPLLADYLASSKQVINDINLFKRYNLAEIIAITGTNGKSTVTTLVGEILTHAGFSANIGGNIGIPALNLLPNHNGDYAVLELSSFHLELVANLQAKVACLLNISADHLDRHGDLASYVAAKQRVFNGAQFAVFNRDDNLTQPVGLSDNTVSFGLSKPASFEFGIVRDEEGTYLSFGNNKLIATDDLGLYGEHNWSNILAAFGICHCLGVPLDTMVEVAKNFSGLPHRCQLVAKHQGVSWVNDSKGTNVGATLAALQGFDSSQNNPLLLIAGGVGKGADFSPLAEIVAAKVSAAILFGQDAELLNASLARSTQTYLVENLSQAVKLAKSLLSGAGTVLFSPACASFDMFKNYMERGDFFCTEVNKLCR